MVTSISHSPAETAALGERWGREAQAGWVLALSGDLGAGKTQLVKGLARGLGISMRVQSPTFSLVNVYSGGRLPLFHLDLYRLETPEQIIAAGLEEYLHPAGVTVIEWAERWFGDLCPDSASVCQPSSRSARAFLSSPKVPGVAFLRRGHLETVNETERRITYEDFSA